MSRSYVAAAHVVLCSRHWPTICRKESVTICHGHSSLRTVRPVLSYYYT